MNPCPSDMPRTARRRRRRNAQCQAVLLHTSFKLRFNGHIITFPPMKSSNSSQIHLLILFIRPLVEQRESFEWLFARLAPTLAFRLVGENI